VFNIDGSVVILNLSKWVSRQLVYGHFAYRHFVYYDCRCWNRSWSDETKTMPI